MPVYNGGHYFRLALESALAQTYDNIEIIVVNDGSTDDGATRAVAEDYASRIRYIEQPNKGVAGALNTAIAAMTGDYFAWLSHDDIHLPEKTERQVAWLRRIGRPDAILFSDYDLIDPDGKLIVPARMPHDKFFATPMLPLLNGAINGCTLLIPAELMRRYGPFDESLRYTQDYDLWNAMLAQHEFFHQPEILVQYRVHPGQDSHKPQAVTEGEALWRRMLDSRTPIERAQLFGSAQRYFESLGAFLEQTPYKEASSYAKDRASKAAEQTLVSVVIPVWNEIEVACRAVRSVLDQTHRNLEVLVVDDGSTEDTTPLKRLAEADGRVRLIRQSNRGPAAARNLGMDKARGEYIAFLDSDDLFLPLKVQRQLELMQRSGRLFSHTSYYVNFPEYSSELGLLRSGAFTGAIYPSIIGGCPIATPTVMLHRMLPAQGFAFPEALSIGEDVLTWIDISSRHECLGIDEPLTVVEWARSSAALSVEKGMHGLSRLLTTVQGHPAHSQHTAQVARLRAALAEIAKAHRQNPGSDSYLLDQLIPAAFGSGARKWTSASHHTLAKEAVCA
ncbi:glycosyltransferase family 2 protein [Azospirillum isscasi]